MLTIHWIMAALVAGYYMAWWRNRCRVQRRRDLKRMVQAWMDGEPAGEWERLLVSGRETTVFKQAELS